jgi:hypothetical protein
VAKPYKVFGVGLQKSGTSTLRTCLEILGYRILRQHKDVYDAYRRGEIERIVPALDAYEAFTGLAPSYLYPLALERYGERCRAVLTMRVSPEAWLASLKSHMLKRSIGGNFINLRFYGHLYPEGRERAFIDHYLRHAEAVRRTFRERGAEGQLLEICWENGEGWPELCAFLGEPVREGPVPQINRTADIGGRPLREIFNRTLMRSYARLIGKAR